MVASLLILALSLVLFAYWFRYSCILILRNRSEQSAIAAAVRDRRFHCVEVRERLKSDAELDALEAALEQDYRVLKYLIKNAAGLELEGLEDRLLMFDYQVMQRVYRVTRLASPSYARKALSEMAHVLDVLTRSIVEQAGVPTEA